LSPGLILEAFCTFFESDPSGGVLGPSLAGKRTKIAQNRNLYLSSLLLPPLSFCFDGCADPKIRRDPSNYCGKFCHPRRPPAKPPVAIRRGERARYDTIQPYVQKGRVGTGAPQTSDSTLKRNCAQRWRGRQRWRLSAHFTGSPQFHCEPARGVEIGFPGRISAGI
jgi:hypothetical protein